MAEAGEEAAGVAASRPPSHQTASRASRSPTKLKTLLRLRMASARALSTLQPARAGFKILYNSTRPSSERHAATA